MSSATVTIRELKNKDTGIDITVPTLKEIKGMLQSTYEFHVVVVSKLPFFKSPKHKETDTVQFMVTKKFNDFVDLHSKLDEKYAATVLPPLPKKALIVNDITARERRASLDKFMHFLASTPKLCTSSILLEFLGVNAIKAGKFRKDENIMDNVSTTKDTTIKDTEEEEIKEPEPSNLFDEEEEEQEEDLFSVPAGSSSKDVPDTITADSLRDKTKLFEDQDFGGAIDDKEEDLFLVPGADDVVEKKQTLIFEDKEEDDDLLNIDQDIENLLHVTKEVKGDKSAGDTPEKQRPKPAPRAKPTIAQKPSDNTQAESVNGNASKSSPDSEHVSSESNKATKPKPAPRQKPNLPDKPKPKLPDKPKPKLPDKPKPELANKPKSASEQGSNKENVSSVDNLDTDDIMKYIQQNTSQNDDDDLDLFS